MSNVNRRKHPRRNIPFRPLVVMRESGLSLGHLGDISAEGMMVHCSQEPPVGEKMSLRILLPPEFPAGLQHVDVFGQVRWTRPEPEQPGWRAGVYFKFLQLKMDYVIRHLMSQFPLAGDVVEEQPSL